MLRQEYDLIIIGGGIAGMELARRMADQMKIALVEKKRLGGTALRQGALPIKRILDSFKNNSTIEENRKMLLEGWEEDGRQLEELLDKKLDHPNIHIYQSDGEFLDGNNYRLDKGEILQADKIVISTGTRAHSPLNLELDEDRIISHNRTIELDDLPSSLMVLGGNVEGIELAFVYALLGSEVVLIEREEEILHGQDRDLVDPILDSFIDLGGKILTSSSASSLELDDEGVSLTLDNGESLRAEKALLALARKANIPRGLENTRVEVESGFISVDENYRTAEESIYAIGDINGIHGMAHVSLDQAARLSGLLRGRSICQGNYDIIPRAIFTLPELAGAGLQEEDCRRENIAYRLGRIDFKDSWRGWSKGMKNDFVKVLISEDDRLLGIWMLGEDVSEYVGFFNYFIVNRTPLDEILSSLLINPSIYEAIAWAMEEALDKEVIKS